MEILVLMLVLIIMFTFTSSSTNSTSETYTLINAINLAKPGCQSRCGDLIVPYPFGIGINSSCSLGHDFDIYCNTSLDPPKAYITKTDYVLIKQISDSTLRVSNLVATKCYSSNGSESNSFGISPDLTQWPYTFSQVNKFIAIGCNDYAWLTSESSNVSTGCVVFCTNPEEARGTECSGNGCCQSSIPQDISYYKIQLNTLLDRDDKGYRKSFNRCTYAFLAEENVFKFNGAIDLNDTFLPNRIEANVPIVLEWAIGNLSCPEVEGKVGFACQTNSDCVSSTRDSGGYLCICKGGYEGNPYLSPGCQDINECNRPEKYPCHGTCVNTQGSYTCQCKRGYTGDAKIQSGCRRKPFPVLQLSLGMVFGFLAILIGFSMLYLVAKKRKLIKLREKFFEQNGGALLEDKLKTTGGIGVGSMKIFQVEELKEATGNYAEDRIIGRGGNGVVYKGTLPDKCAVAIKKSQRLDEGQREQFINEMMILTQINHQNVVQLLGCCLETDVPLLVYEFVCNDTLHHHIHRTSGSGRLSWNSRLRIAHESASALAYLHTDARMSIIHRDVKSTNILLDENYTAKIADFGASRLVPLGHDQVTTLVQGTFGYLDPEYFHTGQLTDKSDVYSFGVLLAELLTGKKPLGPERGLEDRNLANYFLNAKKKNQLFEILERQVVQEATNEQLKAICDLVCKCLNQVGKNRPGMKEVTIELETLRKFGIHKWISQENYNKTSSLMIESEDVDLYTVPLIDNSDTLGEHCSSSTGMKDMMLRVQNPR